MVLLLGAVALLMGRLGYLKGVGFWTILFSACLIGILIKGIFRLKVGSILFSLAFLIIVNDELLHLEAITPWPVLGAALLGTIGLKLLFPNLGRFRRGHFIQHVRNENLLCDINQDNQEGKRMSYDNVFGSANKYISGMVSDVNVDNVFGSVEIYFTDALLSSHTASVNIDSAFGSVTLYVPLNWQVEMNMECVFGSQGERGRSNPDGINVLYVGGDVIFGSVEVIYV